MFYHDITHAALTLGGGGWGLVVGTGGNTHPEKIFHPHMEKKKIDSNILGVLITAKEEKCQDNT